MLTKILIRTAIATGLLLMIPLVAMQFTREVNWTIFDFIVMGALLFSIGFGVQWVASRGRTLMYKAAVAIAFGAVLLLAWVNLAVGIVGSGPNVANLMYLGIFAIGILGSIAARLQPKGMKLTLFAMAIVQMLIPVITLLVADHLLNEPPGVMGIFGLNAFFAMLFAASGLLFRNAEPLESEQQQTTE